VPFELAALGVVAVATAHLHRETPGIWFLFGGALIGTLGETGNVIATTRALAGTALEQRGKQSDDLALAKAQRSLGCIPLLLGVSCSQRLSLR
jgi:hypothetical protein